MASLLSKEIASHPDKRNDGFITAIIAELQPIIDADEDIEPLLTAFTRSCFAQLALAANMRREFGLHPKSSSWRSARVAGFLPELTFTRATRENFLAAATGYCNEQGIDPRDPELRYL